MMHEKPSHITNWDFSSGPLLSANAHNRPTISRKKMSKTSSSVTLEKLHSTVEMHSGGKNISERLVLLS